MIQHILILLLSLSLHLVACAHSPPEPVPAPAPAPAPALQPSPSGGGGGSSGSGADCNATEFVRSGCGCTRYPDLCFASLSPYATDVHRSPALLAHVAANVTLSRLRGLRQHVSALRRAGGLAPGGRVAAALRDCAEQLGDASDQVNQTAEELQGLEALVGTEVAWRVSNAQTWLSAALSNEESCSEGFQEAPSGVDGAVKDDVCRRVRRVKQYTSNALALVNSLVGDRR